MHVWLNCLVGPAQNTEQEAHEQLSYAFDLGVNALDTAEIYPVRPTPPEGLHGCCFALLLTALPLLTAAACAQIPPSAGARPEPLRA
jgi:hypothetical protein